MLEPVDRPAIDAVVARVDALLAEAPTVSDEVLSALAALHNGLRREGLARLRLVAQELADVYGAVQRFYLARPAVGDHAALERAIEGLQTTLEDQHAWLGRMSAGQADAEVRVLARQLIGVAVPLYDAVETMRHLVREDAADASIAAGRTKSFGSMQAAIKYLNRKAG